MQDGNDVWLASENSYGIKVWYFFVVYANNNLNNRMINGQSELMEQKHIPNNLN